MVIKKKESSCLKFKKLQIKNNKRSPDPLAGSTRRHTSSAYLYSQIETIQLDPILLSIFEIIWKQTLSST